MPKQVVCSFVYFFDRGKLGRARGAGYLYQWIIETRASRGRVSDAHEARVLRRPLMNIAESHGGRVVGAVVGCLISGLSLCRLMASACRRKHIAIGVLNIRISHNDF